MKNYQEFIDYVKENVADYLPEKFEQILEETKKKRISY